MSSEQPDPPRPDEPEPEPGLDIDAAFAEIIANWGPEDPEVGDDQPPDVAVAEQDDEDEPEERQEPRPVIPSTPDRESLRKLFRPASSDALDSAATWDDEGHFVPPPPPPLPVVDPRRRLAWGGLFGAPLLALLFIALGIRAPDWVLAAMVAAFVGGFVYLVATMGSPRYDDWTGGDGAVL